MFLNNFALLHFDDKFLSWIIEFWMKYHLANDSNHNRSLYSLS